MSDAMSAMARLVTGKFYRAAARAPEQQPWRRGEPRGCGAEVTDFQTPLPFGPVVRGAGYWFQRAAA